MKILIVIFILIFSQTANANKKDITNLNFKPSVAKGKIGKSHEIVKSLVKAKKNVSYSEIEADQGHDAFLMPIPNYLDVLKNFMANIT